MSKSQVEMIAIAATMLKRDHVFEMLGNLYQIDYVINNVDYVQVEAHIIASLMVDSPRLNNGAVNIRLSNQTQVLIEA